MPGLSTRFSNLFAASDQKRLDRTVSLGVRIVRGAIQKLPTQQHQT
jgi:hypothetical protein